MDLPRKGLIEWAVAAQPLAGQSESGDTYWVKVRVSQALVAVLDGVGHGEKAALAARSAIATLSKFERESPITLFERCHEQLRSTRGVVMSLASFCACDNTMTWLGVGNVEGVLFHPGFQVLSGQETLLPSPGVVGDSLPRLSASVIQVAQGDILIFATDGIRAGFADNINFSESPQQIADRILAQYGRGIDDSLVLVARYLHETAEDTRR